MWRISSPGEYSLCSANSTDEPWYRARCMPDSAPSTITRALIGSDASRARTTGSRPTTSFGGTSSASSAIARLRRDDAEQAVDEVGGAHALGLRAVGQDQAVLQRGPRQRRDVVD